MRRLIRYEFDGPDIWAICENPETGDRWRWLIRRGSDYTF